MNQPGTTFAFDAYSTEIAVDPYSAYRIMRDEHPVLWCESTRAWALSRYADVLAAVQDTATYSSAKGNIINDNPARAGRTLGTTDPPRHDELRKVVNEAFARRTVGEYEAPMRALAEQALAGAARDEVIDLRSVLAFPSSAAVLGEVLGVDLGRHEALASAFITVLDEPLRLGADPSTDNPARGEAMELVIGLVADTIAEHRQRPGSDVVSSLIEAGLTDDELRWIMFTFLGAGLESSTAQFLLSALALAAHPDARHRLAVDPTLLPLAYEELVRYDCGPQRFHRTLTRDVELHGQHMHAGDSVLVLYGSANRDEREFERAEELVIDRRPNKHLGFGRGSHFCIGAPLARLQGQVLFETLLASAPEYAVASDELSWKINPAFRGVKTLPVVLQP
jgi:cytochrome P450